MGGIKYQKNITMVQFNVLTIEDLHYMECQKCIDIIIVELLEVSNGMSGGSAIYGSGYIRFDLYKFDRFLRAL